MNYRTIFDFAEEKQIESMRREKRYIRISAEDFSYIKPHFKQKLNPLRPGVKSYRTEEKLFHCHAIEKKDGTVEMHLDFANADYWHFLMPIPHTVLDVIPFFVVRVLVIFFKILALPKHCFRFFIKLIKACGK